MCSAGALVLNGAAWWSEGFREALCLTYLPFKATADGGLGFFSHLLSSKVSSNVSLVPLPAKSCCLKGMAVFLGSGGSAAARPSFPIHHVDHFPPSQWHIWPQHSFLFPFWTQGSTGWAVPQPDGASGREAWCCCGKDAGGPVPYAPGHHALGLGGHVPRTAHCPSLCGRTPPEVSGLASCFPHLSAQPGSSPRWLCVLLRVWDCRGSENHFLDSCLGPPGSWELHPSDCPCVVLMGGPVLCEGSQSYIPPIPMPGTSQVWLTQRRRVSLCCL